MARIAEDEADAKHVRNISNASWYVHVVHRSSDPEPLTTHSTDGERTRLAQRFDPTRVLAECAVKRSIMSLHKEWRTLRQQGYCRLCGDDGTDASLDDRELWPCQTLRTIASAYASHPDYRQAWQA